MISQPDACSQDRPKTSLLVHLLAAALFVLPLTALCQFIAHLEVAVIDDHLFGYYGWRIWEGARLYLDVWDHKPPLIFWLNALGCEVSGGGYGGIVVFCTLAVLATHALVFAICARLYDRGTAALTTILASLYLTHGLFFAGANRGETFLVPCELAAILFYLIALRGMHRWCWFAAGVCGATAFLFKQSGMAAVAAICLHVLWLAFLGESTFRDALRRLGLLLVGALSIVAIVVIRLVATGALGEAWSAVIGYSRAYGQHRLAERFDLAWWYHWSDRYLLSVLRLPLLMSLAACIHAFCRKRRPQSGGTEDERGAILEPGAPVLYPMRLLVLWFFLSLTFTLLSPGSEGHQFLPTVPPLVLMAGYLIHVLKGEKRLLDRFAQRAWTVVAFVLIAYFASDAVFEQFTKASKVYDDRRPGFENGAWVVEPTVWERMGDAVARRTTPEDKIQTWEYLPAVCLQAKRKTVSRYIGDIYDEMAGLQGNRFGREFSDALERDPPKVIIITAHDYAVLRDAPPEDEAAREKFAWIEEHYRPIDDETRGNMRLFMRLDSNATD